MRTSSSPGGPVTARARGFVAVVPDQEEVAG